MDWLFFRLNSDQRSVIFNMAEYSLLQSFLVSQLSFEWVVFLYELWLKNGIWEYTTIQKFRVDFLGGGGIYYFYSARMLLNWSSESKDIFASKDFNFK